MSFQAVSVVGLGLLSHAGIQGDVLTEQRCPKLAGTYVRLVGRKRTSIEHIVS